MAAGQIADFFATLGFKVNKADIAKVDKTLDHIENRAKRLVEGSLSNMKIQITGYRFSEGFNTRLYKGVQKKLTILNNKKGLSPEITISKFKVDRNELLREMKDAVNYVENNLRVRIRPDVGRPTDTPADRRYGRAGGVSRFGTGMGVGAAAGSLGRGFIPGLGLAFGVSQLNRLNQELIGQNLAATAVFGNQEAGKEQLDWLRSLGNQIGFDYRSQANPYMKMAAAGTTAGMGTGQVQEIFRSMAEYGRVMGLNDEDMKGSMRAVEQMLNKGQVYAEELKMQLGEKFPAAIQLMAEAVAGGDTQKLFDMMEKGEVSSIEALPKFAKILARQARVGGALEEAMKTSLAEQMRFNNTFNDLVMFLSEAGFEEGQAGIFRTMADFFMEMKPLLQGFGEAWKYVADVIRVPLGLLVDFGRGLQSLSEYTGVTKGALLGLGTIVAGLAFPFTRTLTLISGALTLLEDFTGFMSGRRSLLGHVLGEYGKEKQTRENIKQFFSTLGELLKTVVDRGRDLQEILGKGPEIGWIDTLNERIRKLEELLHRISVFFGGKTRQELALEAELSKSGLPASTRADLESQLKAEQDKSWITNVMDKILPSSLSDIGNFAYNMSPYGVLEDLTGFSAKDKLMEVKDNMAASLEDYEYSYDKPSQVPNQNNVTVYLDARGVDNPEAMREAAKEGIHQGLDERDVKEIQHMTGDGVQ